MGICIEFIIAVAVLRFEELGLGGSMGSPCTLVYNCGLVWRKYVLCDAILKRWVLSTQEFLQFLQNALLDTLKQ